jgi:hypothetical protein
MAEEGKAAYAKGDRAAIVEGNGTGMRGEVFWTGPNKYGPGFRYGLRGDDGATYWVNEEQLGPVDAVPEPEIEVPPALDKGQRVRITGGREGVGVEGEIFWVGESRYGPGMRYGVRGPGEDETYWVDSPHVEPIGDPPEKAAPEPAVATAAAAPPAFDDAPLPDEPDEAESGGFEDAPFPDDDEIPF